MTRPPTRLEPIFTLVGQIAPQLRALWPVLAVVYAPTLALLIFIGVQRGIPADVLMRDANSVAGVPFYTGLISNLGALLWTAALAICFFSAATARGGTELVRARAFLIYGGIVALILMSDDFFQLHEEVLRDRLGVPELVTYGAYAFMVVFFLARFRRHILEETDWLLLGIALGFFALSMGIDVLQDHDLRTFDAIGGYVMEDGLKLLGILTWLVYFARYCRRVLR